MAKKYSGDRGKPIGNDIPTNLDFVQFQRRIKIRLRVLLTVASVSIFLIIASGFLPELIESAGREEYGQFGDFVGGTLNPILTFLTFIALIYTVVLQQQELYLARTEFQRTANSLEQENFEATVFRLSTQLREIVNAIDLTIDGETHGGSDAFKAFYDLMKKKYEELRAENPEIEAPYVQAYNAIYEEHGHDFSQFYRFLYNTFRWIKKRKDSFDDNNVNVNDLDVDFYAKIIRAQVSDYELVVFLYNYLAGWSENFNDLLIEFEIFDNVSSSRLLSPEHKQLLKRRLRISA